MRRIWARRFVVAAAVGATVLVAIPSAARANTYTVTSTSLCGGAGTFEQALKDANANPGADTITFSPGLVVDAASCTTAGARPFPFATFATDSVDIVGNGATIEGNQYYVNGSGLVNSLSNCPSHDGYTHMLAKTYGFIQIGTFGADNSAVSVSVTDLKFHNLPTLARVEQSGSFSLVDSTASDIVDFNEACNRPAIEGASGANISLTRTLFVDSTMMASSRSEDSLSAIIAGDGALVLDHARFANNLFGRAVTWTGGTARIDSSLFLNSGGLVLNANTTVMVNSAFYEDGNFGWVGGGQGGANRIVTGRGNTLIRASSFYWVKPTCANCADAGMGFWIASAAARISLRSTAIGSADATGSGPMLIGYNGTGGLVNNFGSDALTWVKPTANQNASDLSSVVPSALTSDPGLLRSATSSSPYVAVLTPLLGDPSTPGVLLDAVGDADCGAANELLSPIDNSCLTDDVFGNPRIDQGNFKRDIGAVQTAQSPHLAVTAVATSVTLGWNSPLDPVSGPITGYRVTYVPVAGGTAHSVELTGRDTSSTVITGLTAGTPYRFTVRPLNVVGAGSPSNSVEATPIDSVSPPAPSATPGDTLAHLSWTEPDLGGRLGSPRYFVLFREAGAPSWTVGPGPITARTTMLPELVNGTTYDLGVLAVAEDGSTSLLGVTTVTPAGAPKAPVLTAKPDGAGTGAITLTWTKPSAEGSPIVEYQVQCRPVGAADWTDYPTQGLTRSLTVAGLTAGVSVECRVAASNGVGASPWSAVVALTPPSDPSQPLANTGFGAWWIAYLAAGLLAAGILLTVLSRTRRRGPDS